MIEEDLAESRRLDVRWTPHVYLNGRVFSGRSLPEFVTAIEGMLKK